MSSILLLLCASCLSVSVSAETYYIVPTDDSPCPDEQTYCMTLSEYGELTHNESLTFETDITLMLAPGSHNLESDVVITNLSSFTIVWSNETLNTTLDDIQCISCTSGASFDFHNIGLIQLSNINFLGCSSHVAIVENLLLDKCQLQGGVLSESKLEILGVDSAVVNNSQFTTNKQAIVTINSNLSIYGCVFDSNHANYAGSSLYALNSSVEITESTFSNNTSVFHGGAIEIDQESELVIDNCTFSGNSIQRSESGEIYLIGGGGICIVNSSKVTVTNSIFADNFARGNLTAGGAIFAGFNSSVIVTDSELFGNTAGNSGGAIFVTVESDVVVRDSIITDTASAILIQTMPALFSTNPAGGAIAGYMCTIEVDNCEFSNNVALTVAGGGAIGYVSGSATIKNSVFVNNKANIGGGAIAVASFQFDQDSSTATSCHIFNCTFIGNTAVLADGGALASIDSILTLISNVFINNSCASMGPLGSGGGVSVLCLYSKSSKSLETCRGTITDSLFVGNRALVGGAAISLQSVPLFSLNASNMFTHNDATSVLHMANSIVIIDGTTVFSNNNGSVFVYHSNVTFRGNLSISRTSNVNSSNNIQIELGGAITCFIGEVVLNGTVILFDNVASYGGGILVMQSSLMSVGELIIVNNTATKSGGGIYAFRTTLTFAGVTHIASNRAQENGGGINGVNAFVSLQNGQLSLVENHAYDKGGGIFFETNSNLHVNKLTPECPISALGCVTALEDHLSLEFIANSADYGGAIYVDDSTTPLVCNVIESEEEPALNADCFFQSIVLYPTLSVSPLLIENFFNSINLVNTYFWNNTAEISGNSLYGGLLDRCTVSVLAEVNLPVLTTQSRRIADAIQYFEVTSNINIDDIKSLPVRVCFCLNNIPDCDYELPTVTVRKGENFSVSLVAVDQLNNIIPSNIISLAMSGSSLQRGQGNQSFSNVCSEIKYNIAAPVTSQSASISVFPDGPCLNNGISVAMIDVQFLACPVGFIDSEVGCKCDPILVSNDLILGNCSIDSQSVVRRANAWINFTQSTQEYLADFNCPLDYCVSSSSEVFVNLNVPNGADVQCANNRSGVLCGGCADGLSLLLGTSRCGECSNHNGLALLIVFAIAGVLLVIFILVCNLTTAVGTINGLISYANIVSTNRPSFFRPEFDVPGNFLVVFISWINLDFGIVACFYDGMDEYSKTWLQLAFPMYVIFLVVLMIIVSEYSRRFSKLIATKNPVATLATLILLSYTRFLRLIINVASFAAVEHYSVIGNESETPIKVDTVWRIDGNLAYFDRKRIPLFLIVILIALIGFCFMFLLLFWQCLQRCPTKKIVSNLKLKSFMDAYHAPFKDSHRYWIGLQLVLRIVLYSIIASNDFNDTANLLCICLAVSILFLMGTIASGGIYKSWLLNTLESVHLFNLLFYALAIIYANEFNEPDNRTPVIFSYISVSISFIIFVGTLVFHIFLFVFPNSTGRLSQFTRKKLNLKRHVSSSNVLAIQENLLTANNPTSSSIRMDALNSMELRNSLRELLEIDPGTTSDIDAGLNQRPDNVPRNWSHSTIDGIPYEEVESLPN